MTLTHLPATVFLLWSLTTVPAAVSGIDVNTTVGMVTGYQMQEQGVTINVFTGIPYAQKPIGDLRFRRPVPLTTWSSTAINATQLPNSCYQLQNSLFAPNTPISEDCLYLNVWAPASSSSSARNVMIWIYGGAFNTGTSTIQTYDGSVLAAVGDVIVVSMQYRLGVLGFLYLGIDDVPGNMGLLDQQVAMQWVQSNIAAFGGDPAKVTIFGESAGGQSVGMHLLSPGSRPLFQRAIMESGAGVSPIASDPPLVALAKSMALANLTGCANSTNRTAMAACLRQVNPSELTALMYLIPSASVTTLVPTVDGYFLLDSPANLLASSNGSLVFADILLGVNHNEGSLFIPAAAAADVPASRDHFITYAKAQPVFSNCPALLATAIFVYTQPETMLGLVNDYRPLEADIVGDMAFVCPAVDTANAYAARGNKVYMYEFIHRTSSMVAPLWMGVPHASELQYVFGTPFSSRNIQTFTPAEKDLARKFLLYWTNFAKYGDPNQGGDPAGLVTLDPWPVYTVANQTYLQLDTDTMLTDQYLRAGFCAFRRELIPELTALCNNSTTRSMSTTTPSTSHTTKTTSAAHATHTLTGVTALCVMFAVILLHTDLYVN